MLLLLTVRSRQMRENKWEQERPEQDRSASFFLFLLLLSFTARAQTNIVSRTLIELAGNQK